MYVGRGGSDPALHQRFEAQLDRPSLSSFAVHGTVGYRGFAGTGFLFARPPDPSVGYATELPVPHLHLSFMRMLRAESVEEPVGMGILNRNQLIALRDVEILQWVRDCRSNQEIGQILGISPLTVKNHVQKILRKLNVRNRAQAVAKGIALTLIGDDG
jgi:DNA-binding CsgD family transcriptional regulator